MSKKKKFIVSLILIMLTGCGFTAAEFAVLAIGIGAAAAGGGGGGGSSTVVGITGADVVTTPMPDPSAGASAPSIANLTGPTSAYQGEAVTFSFDFSDTDGDIKEVLFAVGDESRYYIISNSTTETSGTMDVILSLVKNFTPNTYTFKFALRDEAGNVSNQLITSVEVRQGSAPDVVMGPNPVDGALNVALTTSISWNSAERATSYDVYFSTTPAPTLFCASVTITSVTPGLLEYDTTYYWRIDSKNSFGTTSGTVWSFTTESAPVSAPSKVTGPNPADEATMVSITSDISWTAASGATSYDVYIDTLNPPITLASENHSSTGYDPGTLNYDTTYYWRIDSKNDAGTTTGDVWSFRTIMQKPAQASNPNPTDGQADVLTTTALTWDNSARAEGYYIHFGTGTSPEYAGETTAATYDPGALAYLTTYYWKVIAYNAAGNATAFTWSFSTEAPPLIPPDAAANPNPADGADNVSVTADLSWSAAARAEGYYVHFGTTASPPYIGENTSATGYDPGTLGYDTTYYWKVVPYNAAGNASGAVTWSFTTESEPLEAPEQASNPTPGNGAADIPLTIVLQWDSANRAEGYYIHFGTTSNPPYNTSVAGESWDPGGLDYDTTYYWKIIAHNAAGNATAVTWDFITEAEQVGLTTAYVSATGDNSNSGTSWANAVRTIQCGINIAAENGTVIIADGTYTGSGNKDIDFNGKNVHVVSANGAEVCIIDCQGSGRGFYLHNGEDNKSIIEGFTIRNAHKTGGFGGGISCDTSSPIIKNCIFNSNTAGYGGGVCYFNSVSPVIISCTFENNTAYYGGAVNCTSSDSTIKSCTFRNNNADVGGCIRITVSGTIFYNCIIWQNTSPDGNQCNIASDSSITMSYCCYDNSSGHKGGTGTLEYSDHCITSDPQFLPTTLHLSMNSPCIDMGCNSYITEQYDLDNNQRMVGGTVDMGAYEYHDLVVDLTTGQEYYYSSLPGGLSNETYKLDHMVLKYIPAGSFQMGDQVGEGDSDELPVHTVNITQEFYMGVFEVTQRQWYEIMGDWPSNFTSTPDKRPVERVSWLDIADTGGFMDTLSGLTSETYRLPTEAEWEYCCKAGASTSYSYGSSADGAYMWYDSNSSSETHEVGTKLPNPWGLYDMHGNVWEWCNDWYDPDYYDVSPADNPQGPAGPLTYRVLRGGGWDGFAYDCRSANRFNNCPVHRDFYYGFRACRVCVP